MHMSASLFGVLMERTAPRLYDKRKNASTGRGVEFRRLPERDYGVSSADAQLARFQMHMKLVKCTPMQDLLSALDYWGALERELTWPLDESFHVLALREPIPKRNGDMMLSQVALGSSPAALMFVRRQVAEHRHAHSAGSAHSHGDPPLLHRGGTQGGMDWQAGGHAVEEDVGEVDMTRVIPVIKGKSKGKGWVRQQEGRDCYNCGKVGHLVHNCPSPGGQAQVSATSDPKDDGQGQDQERQRPVGNRGDRR